MINMVLSQSKYIALFLGLAVGFVLMWQRRERAGFKKWWQVLLLSVFYTVFSVLSAVLFAAFEQAISGSRVEFGAISTYGVYFFFPVFLLIAVKALKLDMKGCFDLYAVYALPSLFFLRINCLISGCCGGKTIPWIHGSFNRYPTRESEMIFYVVMLFVFIRRNKAGTKPGTDFPLLLAAYGAFRFIEEWLRASSTHSLIHLTHLWSVIAFIVGLSIYFEMNSDSGKRRSYAK